VAVNVASVPFVPVKFVARENVKLESTPVILDTVEDTKFDRTPVILDTMEDEKFDRTPVILDVEISPALTSVDTFMVSIFARIPDIFETTRFTIFPLLNELEEPDIDDEFNTLNVPTSPVILVTEILFIVPDTPVRDTKDRLSIVPVMA
jgi:hypothetical protein